MTVDLEIVIRALSGAFVTVSLSSVALLTGTPGGFLSDFKLRYVRDACPLEWARCEFLTIITQFCSPPHPLL